MNFIGGNANCKVNMEGQRNYLQKQNNMNGGTFKLEIVFEFSRYCKLDCYHQNVKKSMIKPRLEAYSKYSRYDYLKLLEV